MLDLRTLVANVDQAKTALKKRGGGEKWLPVVDHVVAQDAERRKSIQTVEALKGRRNAASQEIAKTKKAGGDATPISAKR